MPQVYTHHGPLSTVGTGASPGLLFLQRFLPALDSLDPASTPIQPFLTPGAIFIFNSGTPTPSDQILSMLEPRSKKLSKFHHEVHVAWDMEKEDDGKKARRTVMYESTSITVFREDSEQLEIRVPEFNIIEIEEDEEGLMKAVELRTFMDVKPVQERMSELQQQQST